MLSSRSQHDWVPFAVKSFAVLSLFICLSFFAPHGFAQSESAQGTSGSNAEVEALIDALEDPQTRDTIITALKESSNASDGDQEPTETSQDLIADGLNLDGQMFAQLLAEQSASFAESFYAGLVGFLRDVDLTISTDQNTSTEPESDFVSALPDLAITFAFLLIGALILARLRPIIHHRFNLVSTLDDDGDQKISEQAALVRLVSYLLIGALSLAINIFIAYFASIYTGETGTLTEEQALLLNAFTICGVAFLCIDLLVHPSRTEFTIFRLPTALAGQIHRSTVILISLFAYGLVFIVPVTDIWFGGAAANVLHVVILSGATIWALIAIRGISKSLSSQNTEAKTASPHKLYLFFAYLYFILVWAVGIAQPQHLVSGLGATSLQILLILVAFIVAWRLLEFWRRYENEKMDREFKEPLTVWQRFEQLVPATSYIISGIIIAIALVLCAHALHLIDIPTLVANPQLGLFLADIIIAILVLAGSAFVWIFASSLIDQRLNAQMEGRRNEQRKRTLLALFKNALGVVIVVFTTMTVLSQLGLDIAPLLAGAGVVGLAVGFGAQKLVQDVITGIFIQLENAFNVGDVVTVAGITGSVEQFSIRSVGMRDLSGTYHIIPFSSVDTVSNSTHKFSFHVAEIGVAYKEDIERVKSAMIEAFALLKTSEFGADILGDFEMHGVTALADNSVNIRGRIKTKPGKQWGVGRAYTQIVKTLFDELNIDIPFPHRTLIFSPSEANELPQPQVEKPARSSRTKPAAQGEKPTTDDFDEL